MRTINYVVSLLLQHFDMELMMWLFKVISRLIVLLGVKGTMVLIKLYYTEKGMKLCQCM